MLFVSSCHTGNRLWTTWHHQLQALQPELSEWFKSRRLFKVKQTDVDGLEAS